MNFRRAFEIAFVGLKPGVHPFEFEVDNKFFANYGNHDFESCTAKILLKLDKKSSFMLLLFDVDGWVQTSCDRCGNSLRLQLWEEFKMMIKLVDNPEELNDQEEDPDVYYISKGESHLHLADWIHEFVTLSIPMQKRCAENDMGESQCNIDVLKKLANMENEISKEHNNPLMQQLKKFKKTDL